MPRGSQRYDKEDIKAMIWKRGSTLRQLSLQAGLNIDAAAQSLTSPKPEANKIIAEFLGISLNALWPQWYDQNGNRIKAYRHAQNVAQTFPAVSAKSA